MPPTQRNHLCRRRHPATVFPILTRKQFLTYYVGMEPAPHVDVFAAIAHPVRRRILDLLAEEDLPVNTIATHFDISRPAVSQHLRVLLEARLVVEQRHGRERRYRLVPDELVSVNVWLAHFERFWTDHLRRLSAHLSAEENP